MRGIGGLVVDDVHVEWVPLDVGVGACLVEPRGGIRIALNKRDPELAATALADLIRRQFETGAWTRTQNGPAAGQN